MSAIYRSMNSIGAQKKNCPFGDSTVIELKNITTTFDKTDTLVT